MNHPSLVQGVDQVTERDYEQLVLKLHEIEVSCVVLDCSRPRRLG